MGCLGVLVQMSCMLASKSKYGGDSAFVFLAAGTPYEGGVFRMKLVLGRDFPAAPPQGKKSMRWIKLSAILGHDWHVPQITLVSSSSTNFA